MEHGHNCGWWQTFMRMVRYLIFWRHVPLTRRAYWLWPYQLPLVWHIYIWILLAQEVCSLCFIFECSIGRTSLSLAAIRKYVFVISTQNHNVYWCVWEKGHTITHNWWFPKNEIIIYFIPTVLLLWLVEPVVHSVCLSQARRIPLE